MRGQRLVQEQTQFREHSQNSWEILLQKREYTKRVTFNQLFETKKLQIIENTMILPEIRGYRNIIRRNLKMTSRISSQV